MNQSSPFAIWTSQKLLGFSELSVLLDTYRPSTFWWCFCADIVQTTSYGWREIQWTGGEGAKCRIWCEQTAQNTTGWSSTRVWWLSGQQRDLVDQIHIWQIVMNMVIKGFVNVMYLYDVRLFYKFLLRVFLQLSVLCFWVLVLCTYSEVCMWIMYEHFVSAKFTDGLLVICFKRFGKSILKRKT